MAGDSTSASGVNGVTDFVGHVVQSDGSGGWNSVVGNSAAGTAPHADSRDIEFDANRNMLEADDGGIYWLVNPTATDGSRHWESVLGNLRPTEVNSVAYDTLNNVFFTGNQDTGTAEQTAPGSFTWSEYSKGDGNTVAVAHYVGETVHYLLGNNFNFISRKTVNSFNQLVAGSNVNLTLANSPSGAALSGLNNTLNGAFSQTDRNFSGFYTIPFEVNSYDPEYLLMGLQGVYTSSNRDDVIADITPSGMNGVVSALAYGGTLNGTQVRDLAYVGNSAGNLFARFDGGGLVATQFGTATNSVSGGVGIRDIALDPENARTAYVLDTQSRIWRGTNVGLGAETWDFLLTNLSVGSDLRTIMLYNTTTAPGDETLLVGGFVGGEFGAGVFFYDNPYAPGDATFPYQATFNKFGSNLPNVMVTDLRYDATDDLLYAAHRKTVGGNW